MNIGNTLVQNVVLKNILEKYLSRYHANQPIKCRVMLLRAAKAFKPKKLRNILTFQSF